MQRIVVLGRGGAGKSTLACRLARELDLPLVELDKVFWRDGLRPTPPAVWAGAQQELIERDRWIIDGDLGPYDTALDACLRAADMIIVLDFPLWLCAWRALRRSRERWDFWRWVIRYRRDSLPELLAAIERCGGRPAVRQLRSPAALEQWAASPH